MSFGSKKSKSSSSSTQKVWGEQSPYLTDLYSKAQEQAVLADPYTQAAQKSYFDMASKLGLNYADARQGFQESLGQGSPYGQLGEQASTTMQGMMTQDPVNNPYLQSNVQNAMDQVTRNLQRNILPGVGMEAQDSGQYGSSRHGIAEGLAMSDANRQAADMASQMYGQAYDQGMQNRLQATGQASSLLGQGTQAGMQELEGYRQLANLGMMQGQAYQQAGQAGFDPLTQYADIVGGPATLTDSTSMGSSGGFNAGINAKFAL